MAFLNLVKVNTATAGTGTVTLGTAVAGFLTPAQAGAVDGATYSYGIVDGTNTETGTGTYTAAGTTLTRSVLNSTNSNALLTLSGTAIVFLTPNTSDLNALAPKVSPTFTGTVTIPTPVASDNSTAAASTAYAQTILGLTAISTTGGTTTLTAIQAAAGIIVITGVLASAATINLGSGSAAFFNRAYTIYNATTGAFSLTVQACVATPGVTLTVAQGYSSEVFTNNAGVFLAGNDVSLFPTFTSTAKGIVPASGGGTTTFLRADGTFAAPPGGSLSFTVVTKSATYTEATTSGEIIILADLVAGFTITLPTAVSNTAKLTIKKMQSSGSIVVNTTSAQTIDGGLTATLTSQYSVITLVSNNSNWMIL